MPIREMAKSLGKRIEKDRARHREKINDYIRKNISDIIAQEDIITGNPKDKVRVTVPMLKDYYFKFKDPGEGVGSGKGKGKEGKDGEGGSQPGSEPGTASYDVEIELEELIDIALDDCGLPNLSDRATQETEIIKGYTTKSYEKKGPWSLFHPRKTVRAIIRRQTDILIGLMRLSGATKEQAEKALIVAKGDTYKAYKILRHAMTLADATGSTVEQAIIALYVAKEDIFDAYELLLQVLDGKETLPDDIPDYAFFPSEDDFRFTEIQEERERVSKAVIFLVRDWSYSMESYKYLTRIALFWLAEAIRRLYRHVKIVAIGYEARAERVSEEELFERSVSGGTRAESAYHLISEILHDEFPPAQWDSYIYQFSDGGDWAPAQAGEELEKLLKSGVNFVGYGEIFDSTEGMLHIEDSMNTLMSEFRNRFSLELESGDGYNIQRASAYPLVGVEFADKSHIKHVVRAFLPKDYREVKK